LSGFEAISKETILARNEVVEGGTVTKENRVGVGRNRTQQHYIKVNFEDLEKPFDFN
jgi:hypothetical protein